MDLLTQLLQVLSPQMSPAGGMPLPMRRPEPAGARPAGFAVPNVHSNFDPRTGQFRGAQTADAGIPPPMRNPGAPVPPLPMRNPQQNGAPPLPMQRPEPPVANAPPPVRRPGQPNVPGIMVDSSIPMGGLVDAARDGGMGLMHMVNQGADQGGLMSALRGVFGGAPIATGMNPQRVFDGVGGPAQGTPQPAIPQPAEAPQTASIGPFETTVTPAQSGPSITGKDVAGFFRNLARGAAGADPTAPPLSAFAQGMAGSMVGMDKESREAAAAEAAGEDREFERRMKTTDSRLRQSKDQREARSAEIANTKAVTEIMRNLGGDLTTDQKFRFEGAIRDYAKAINPFGSLTEEELKPKLEAYRQELMGNIGVGGGRSASAPSQFQEGQTATGPNGQKIIFRGGRWQPLG